MTIEVIYEKNKVIQGLRYHFISRKELRLMIILVNVFALFSAALFYFKLVTPLAFLIGSTLWFVMMLSVWFILPNLIYKRTSTFKDRFQMSFDHVGFSLGNERGGRSWEWKTLVSFLESPHFFHLYFDSRSFFLVPKNGCKSSEELFELRQLLKERIRK